jgi:hypothetical protein
LRHFPVSHKQHYTYHLISQCKGNTWLGCMIEQYDRHNCHSPPPLSVPPSPPHAPNCPQAVAAQPCCC